MRSVRGYSVATRAISSLLLRFGNSDLTKSRVELLMASHPAHRATQPWGFPVAYHRADLAS
jgi:hypothetical protein